MSDEALALMDCWQMSVNPLGVVCVHTDEGLMHSLQQAVNGWIFMPIDVVTQMPVIAYILDIDPNDVAKAQNFAHRLIEQERDGFDAILTFYNEHDPDALANGWHGPDPLGGYGRVINGDLFLINQGTDFEPRGVYMMQRVPLRSPRSGNRMPMRSLEGGDLADVQRRAFVLASEW